MATHKNQHRDLLVLINNEYRSQSAIDHEVEWLHEVLFHVESLDNFCIAHELINVNRHKITSNLQQIKKEILRKKETAFVFISNKN
jgi:hypothetical protein